MGEAHGRVDALAVELAHGRRASLLALARRYSICAEDAEDAYQRALEILLTRAPTTDPERLARWLRVVVKHEAENVRRDRSRALPIADDEIERGAGHAPSPEERAEHNERLRLGAEALRTIKPQHAHCLALRASGLSYAEIAARTGFSARKVDRYMTKGRKAFAQQVAGIEAGAECRRHLPGLSALADGEASGAQLAEAVRHLRSCQGCRATLREYRATPARAAAFAPAGALAAEPGPGMGERALELAAAGAERAKQQLAALASRAPGADAGSQLAAAGGLRGSGAVAVALVSCAVAGGGAAYCATEGIPAPLRSLAASTGEAERRGETGRERRHTPAAANAQPRPDGAVLSRSEATGEAAEHGASEAAPSAPAERSPSDGAPSEFGLEAPADPSARSAGGSTPDFSAPAQGEPTTSGGEGSQAEFGP